MNRTTLFSPEYIWREKKKIDIPNLKIMLLIEIWFDKSANEMKSCHYIPYGFYVIANRKCLSNLYSYYLPSRSSTLLLSQNYDLLFGAKSRVEWRERRPFFFSWSATRHTLSNLSVSVKWSHALNVHLESLDRVKADGILWCIAEQHNSCEK